MTTKTEEKISQIEKLIEKEIKADKKKLIKLIFSIIITAIATILTLVWFNWELLLIIFLFLWANNISNNEKE